MTQDSTQDLIQNVSNNIFTNYDEKTNINNDIGMITKTKRVNRTTSEPTFMSSKHMPIIGVVLLLMYLILGQIMSFVRNVCEILVFTIMPLKIAFQVFSTNSDLKLNISNTIASTTDIRELKQVYKQSKKLKKIRSDYGETLLRQTFVVILIRLMMALIPLIEMIPIIGLFIALFSNCIYIFLLFLTILIQIPTSILNSFIDIIMCKFYMKHHNLHLSCPLSDKIILWIKGFMNDSKLTSIRIVRDIALKYDMSKCDEHQCHNNFKHDNFKHDELKNDDHSNLLHSSVLMNDIEKLSEALNNLGISKEYLRRININNFVTLIKYIKQKTNLFFAKGFQLLFDDNTNIQDLMIDIIRKTIMRNSTDKLNSKTKNKNKNNY